MTITITVAGRIATATATTQVVAGNTYPVAVSLDSEWTGNLFMRVRFGSLYYDIPFASTDTAVDVQFPVGYPEVGIGVFSEALQVCTNEVRIRLLRSILEAGEQVVEFDGDLYDQWAGEVTTLLTDDAFDAESTRPVQNAVLTAWKGTVALDASVVHNTGNESILGQKTFLGSPIVQSSTPTTSLVSTLAHDASSNKAILTVYDQKDGANSAQSQIVSKTASGYEQIAIRASTPNRQSNYEVVNRAFSDHQLVMVTAPYYPVAGSGNPQALTANALMASGNIAVDPRLVHTTGNEEIAGDKTFNGNFTAKQGSFGAVQWAINSSGVGGKWWKAASLGRYWTAGSPHSLVLTFLASVNDPLTEINNAEVSIVTVLLRQTNNGTMSGRIYRMAGPNLNTMAVVVQDGKAWLYALSRNSQYGLNINPLTQQSFGAIRGGWLTALTDEEKAESGPYDALPASDPDNGVYVYTMEGAE